MTVHLLHRRPLFDTLLGYSSLLKQQESIHLFRRVTGKQQFGCNESWVQFPLIPMLVLQLAPTEKSSLTSLPAVPSCLLLCTAFLPLARELSASYLSELGHCWTGQEPVLASGKWKQLPAWKKKEDKVRTAPLLPRLPLP